MKHGKRYNKVLKTIDRMKEYSIADAISLVQEAATAKFDETVEVAVNLDVDPRHADQNIRITTSLPNGTGQEVKVLVLTSGAQAKEAQEAGADYVGDDDLIKKLESGWDEIDVIVATPDMMPKLGKLGKILGPKGLMPNPKSGTVTNDVTKAIKEIKAGRIELRVDKYGIIHVPIGKSSFEPQKLSENLRVVMTTLINSKPASVKGTYLRKITVSSCMGPGIRVDKAAIV